MIKITPGTIFIALGGVIFGIGIAALLMPGARLAYATDPLSTWLGTNAPAGVCPTGQKRNAAGKCVFPPITAAPGAPYVKKTPPANNIPAGQQVVKNGSTKTTCATHFDRYVQIIVLDQPNVIGARNPRQQSTKHT